jgi:hypothetical protein
MFACEACVLALLRALLGVWLPGLGCFQFWRAEVVCFGRVALLCNDVAQVSYMICSFILVRL